MTGEMFCPIHSGYYYCLLLRNIRLSKNKLPIQQNFYVLRSFNRFTIFFLYNNVNKRFMFLSRFYSQRNIRFPNDQTIVIFEFKDAFRRLFKN